MKKAINKGEREHILLQLVSHACTKTACLIVEELAVLRREIRAQLLAHWENAMPRIRRADQLELINVGASHSLSFQPNVHEISAEGKAKNVGEFCKITWRNDGMSDSKKARLSLLASSILDLVPGRTGIVVDGVSTSWVSSFHAPSTFADIVRGFQPDVLYIGENFPEHLKNPSYNNALVQYHKLFTAELTKLKDLLFSAEDMYHDLGAAIAPLKTAQALAEAMPEAVKHFPASLTYVKPTKEIADPAAINEIRAKLKKGLPI